MMISACSPRPIMPSSMTPAISWPKRTQRVQWMQRVMSVEISGPRFLLTTTRLSSVVARAARAVADREVLQLAFAALVADRAVERMVDEQELHHAFLRVDRQLGVRPDLHAFGRPASRTRAAAWAPSRPARGTCGSWPRSTASCDSRSAARRCRACCAASMTVLPCGHFAAACRRFRVRACVRPYRGSLRAAHTARCRHEAVLVLDVVLELVAEMLDEARTGIAAASPSAQIVRPCDVVGDVVQQVEVLVACPCRARCGRPCGRASRCLRGTACTGRTIPRSRSTTGAAASAPCSASRP